jgi:hypothetical protein
LVKKGLKQQKMASGIDDRPPTGRESLWTTDKKVEFAKAHWSRNEKTRKILFKGLNLAIAQVSTPFETFGTGILATTCSHSDIGGQD